MVNFSRSRVIRAVLIAAAVTAGATLTTPAIGQAATRQIVLPDYTMNYYDIQDFYKLGGTNANGSRNAGAAASKQCENAYQEKYPGWYIDASSYRIGSYPNGSFYVRAQCRAYKFQ